MNIRIANGRLPKGPGRSVPLSAVVTGVVASAALLGQRLLNFLVTRIQKVSPQRRW